MKERKPNHDYLLFKAGAKRFQTVFKHKRSSKKTFVEEKEIHNQAGKPFMQKGDLYL